jgi:hypothetical protein
VPFGSEFLIPKGRGIKGGIKGSEFLIKGSEFLIKVIKGSEFLIPTWIKGSEFLIPKGLAFPVPSVTERPYSAREPLLGLPKKPVVTDHCPILGGDADPLQVAWMQSAEKKAAVGFAAARMIGRWIKGSEFLIPTWIKGSEFLIPKGLAFPVPSVTERPYSAREPLLGLPKKPVVTDHCPILGGDADPLQVAWMQSAEKKAAVGFAAARMIGRES